MHTLVIISLVLLIFGVGPGFYPGGAYRGYGWYGVALCLIMLCILFLFGALRLA